jgi:hypothetical protein
MADELKKGDEVSWNWGSGQPCKLSNTIIFTEVTNSAAGTVAEVKAGKAEVESKKGNKISKNGTEDDPAVVIERSGVSDWSA